MWVGFAVGSLLGNGKDECNPAAAELHSQKGLSLWRLHAHIAGVSPQSRPASRLTDLSGAQRVTAAPQPFSRETISNKAASDSAA